MHRKGLLGCVDDGRGERETVQECLLWLAVASSFFLRLLFGRCVLQKGKGRTVACSVRTVVTYCFVMRELLELSPRCFYIRRSLGMKLCSAKKKVLTLECAFIHLWAVRCLRSLSSVCIYTTRGDICDGCGSEKPEKHAGCTLRNVTGCRRTSCISHTSYQDIIHIFWAYR